MMRSLFAGVSGLKNQQRKMDVIANNIANVNSIGFKASRINFAQEFGQILNYAKQSVSGAILNPLEIGLGVKTSNVSKIFTQGILQNTGISTDLAIQGDGFFIVGDGSKQFYTRAGNFYFDEQGRLQTPAGHFVKGWLADATGVIPEGATLEDIIVDPSMISPAKATTKVNIAGNLDARAFPVKEVWSASKVLTVASTGEIATETTDLNDLTQTSTPLVDGDTIVISGTNPDGTEVNATFTYGAGNDGTTIQDLLNVINSNFNGATATLDSGIIKISDNGYGDSQLTLALAQGDSNTGVIDLPSFINSAVGETPKVTTSIIVYDSLGSAHTLNLTFIKTENDSEWKFQTSLDGQETILQGGSGTIKFRPDGSLETVLYDQAESNLVFDPQNGAEQVSIALNFQEDNPLAGLTSYDSNSSITLPFQDGYTFGKLATISFDESGQIFGQFTNGQSQLLGQIALANFTNIGGLIQAGNSLFEASQAAGEPFIGKAGADISSTIVSGALENSNVDLAQEFSEMIIAQRAFQANARVITVSDQIFNEVVQLKR